MAPSGTNQPPVVTNIRSVGSRSGQPSGFADQDETVTLIATVSDAETSTSSLVFAWSGPGSFSATEPITIWHLPATVTPVPSPVTATLTVTENYVEGSVTHRNVTTAPFVMQVHDSQKEILDMGEDFLTLFSQSNVSTNDVLHNFSTACGGRDAEAVDTDRARSLYVQNFSKFRISRILPVLINFGGRCPFRARPGDACSAFNVHWEITYIKADEFHYVGEPEITDGVDYVTRGPRKQSLAVVRERFQRRQHEPEDRRETTRRVVAMSETGSVDRIRPSCRACLRSLPAPLESCSL